MENGNIIYRNLTSPIGDMIAGASKEGLCFLEWHDRGGVDRIKERVQKRYKMSLDKGDSDYLDRLETELSEYFNGDRKFFSIPLDIQGTTFEKLDWEQLLNIPYGETRSYGDIAKALGKPKAPRAVGRANGANYISIVIPCHRVIEANGNLRGYGGGLHRKKFLLELERAK